MSAKEIVVRPAVSGLYIYPVKSCRAISLEQCAINQFGLADDRVFAVVDAQNKVLTARELPELLNVSVQISDVALQLEFGQDGYLYQMERYPKPLSPESFHIRFFSEILSACELTTGVNEWLSARLGVSCKLVTLSRQNPRSVLARRGGKPGDLAAFPDECPILMISEESLADLNVRLESPIEMLQFRPNIVISGCTPYQEEEIGRFRIGGVEFEVTQQCNRCVFATIDPITGKKSIDQEPLKTLASYRRRADGRVSFGVHVIPRSKGVIKTGMELN